MARHLIAYWLYLYTSLNRSIWTTKRTLFLNSDIRQAQLYGNWIFCAWLIKKRKRFCHISFFFSLVELRPSTLGTWKATQKFAIRRKTKMVQSWRTFSNRNRKVVTERTVTHRFCISTKFTSNFGFWKIYWKTWVYGFFLKQMLRLVRVEVGMVVLTTNHCRCYSEKRKSLLPLSFFLWEGRGGQEVET